VPAAAGRSAATAERREGEGGGQLRTARVREGVTRREEERSCGRAGGAVVVGSQRGLTRRKGWTRGGKNVGLN
jgi:hypothetical protein